MRVDFLRSEKGWSWIVFTIQNQPFAHSLMNYATKSDAVRAFNRLKKLFEK